MFLISTVLHLGMSHLFPNLEFVEHNLISLLLHHKSVSRIYFSPIEINTSFQDNVTFISFSCCISCQLLTNMVMWDIQNS